MNNEHYYIPKHLDTIPRFLIWPLDEWMVMAAAFSFCIIFRYLLIGILVSLIARKAWVVLKKGEMHNPLLLINYWYLPGFVKIPGIPASYHRVFVG